MMDRLNDRDWACAFEFAGDRTGDGYCYDNADGSMPFDIDTNKPSEEPVMREHVVEIFGIIDGEHDGENWKLFGALRNGRYFYLSAGCDYTGWDCKSSGECLVSSSFDAIKFRIPVDVLQEMGI